MAERHSEVAGNGKPSSVGKPSADLSSGNVFYLYSPFNSSIFTDVLSALRTESTHRSLKICSLGPDTHTVAKETWLKASALPDTGRVTVFDSK
jgi:hypothetical protein